MPKCYGEFITNLEPHQIFVFGSNTEGKHGAGAAKIAKLKYGAIYGKAIGRQGQSYAIITKDLSKGMRSITPYLIKGQINDLYNYAKQHPELEFHIAYANIGIKNLNGYSHEEMADFFSCVEIPENIFFSTSYINLIKGKK